MGALCTIFATFESLKLFFKEVNQKSMPVDYRYLKFFIFVYLYIFHYDCYALYFFI